MHEYIVFYVIIGLNDYVKHLNLNILVILVIFKLLA